jgi:acyl-CoA synthetase (AMP-forming)/AMP-acid ligase II
VPSPPASTLLEALERWNREEPERVAFRFGGRDHTFGELWHESGRFASGLTRRGVGSGERVVLVLENGPAFFHAFYGTQRAGAVPVPIFPGSGPDRVHRLAGLCGAALTVSGPSAFEEIVADAGAVVPVSARPVSPADTALIQYTSGSTGDPKGVVIRHENLVTNVGQMIEGMEITDDDVFVSWLPVHHDMGLVLMTMVPFSLGARLVLLPSSLSDVRAWLRSIAEHRGTFTAAPDFAYRLCLRAIRDPSRFDLRSLRVALNAAEPVRATTIRRFEEAFGLDRVMVAGYGLAEATVGVSMQPPGSSPTVSVPDRSGHSGEGLVSIGRPFPGVRIRVVPAEDAEGPESRDPIDEPGRVGELVVESPANTSGYFRDPEATADLFWRPGVIRTGDLGYEGASGDVFIIGRAKNVILQAGRNLAPQEIEEAVEALPFVRRAAAVGVDRGDAAGEQAYVFAELRKAKPPDEERLHEMVTELVSRIHEHLGMRPGRVFLLLPRAIPLTPNGKIRHAALREEYLDGGLRERGAVLFPE